MRPGEVMVTGDAVNVAARVQQMAESGQILVTGRTAAAASDFRYGPAHAQSIRGKAGPVDVTELLEVDGGPVGVRRRHVRAPLVGREDELTLLTSIFDRVARERRPHLVTLYGQPGVGKSRLTGSSWTSCRSATIRRACCVADACRTAPASHSGRWQRS